MRNRYTAIRYISHAQRDPANGKPVFPYFLGQRQQTSPQRGNVKGTKDVKAASPLLARSRPARGRRCLPALPVEATGQGSPARRFSRLSAERADASSGRSYAMSLTRVRISMHKNKEKQKGEKEAEE